MSTDQNTNIALFLSSPNAEDGRILDAEDSMLGQPPSVCTASPLPTHAGRDRRKKSYQDQDLGDIDVEQDLDMALRHMYREVQEENIEGCVLEERLDEKDVALMDGASVSVIFSWLVTALYNFILFDILSRCFLPSVFSAFRISYTTSLGSATPSPAHRASGATSAAYKHEGPHTWRRHEYNRSAAHYTGTRKRHQTAQPRVILEVRNLLSQPN